MTFPTRPKADGPNFDVAEQARLAKNDALELGYSLDEAKKIAVEAVRRLEYDRADGAALWLVEGGQKVHGIGRHAVVRSIHERRLLLTYGPDPQETVRQRLRERDYTDAEIVPLIERAGLGRERDGRVRYRGRYSPAAPDPDAPVDRESLAARSEELLKTAVTQLADQIEAQRPAANASPEVEAGVRARGYGI